MNYGLIRRIDDLGRIVIPKEIRRRLNIEEGDSFEILTENDENGKYFLKIKPYLPQDLYKDCKDLMEVILKTNCRFFINSSILVLIVPSENIGFYIKIKDNGEFSLVNFIKPNKIETILNSDYKLSFNHSRGNTRIWYYTKKDRTEYTEFELKSVEILQQSLMTSMNLYYRCGKFVERK